MIIATDLSHINLACFCRFDFDLSVEESSQRRLDLSVKNSVSFISRERELIGKVFVIGHVWNSACLCPRLCKILGFKLKTLLLSLVAFSCSWTWTKLTSRRVSHSGNYLTLSCINYKNHSDDFYSSLSMTKNNPLSFLSFYFQVRLGSRDQLKESMPDPQASTFKHKHCFCDLWFVRVYIQLKCKFPPSLKKKKWWHICSRKTQSISIYEQNFTCR